MEILDLKQAAEFLKISPASLRAKARAGNAPGSKVVGRWRFRKSDLYDWLAPQDFNGEKRRWESISEGKSGGLISQRRAESEYNNLLGLTIE